MTALLEVPALSAESTELAELPCREEPDLFFAESPSDVELAKSMCGSCPIRAACLEEAIERREPWGVWGGEVFEAGRVIERKRRRGRPRKSFALS